MKKSAGRELTGIDRFTIITGVIGVATNVVTLLSLFMKSQKSEDVGHQKPGEIPAAVWVLVFFSIVYSTCIVSFYSRKLLSKRHKRKNGILLKKARERIEFGAGAFTVIFGGTFFLILAIAGAIVVDMPIFEVVFFGGPLALLVSLGLNFLVMLIYSAFDSGYWADWDDVQSSQRSPLSNSNVKT
jgi:hypothetical protein